MSRTHSITKLTAPALVALIAIAGCGGEKRGAASDEPAGEAAGDAKGAADGDAAAAPDADAKKAEAEEPPGTRLEGTARVEADAGAGSPGAGSLGEDAGAADAGADSSAAPAGTVEISWEDERAVSGTLRIAGGEVALYGVLDGQDLRLWAAGGERGDDRRGYVIGGRDADGFSGTFALSDDGAKSSVRGTWRAAEK